MRAQPTSTPFLYRRKIISIRPAKRVLRALLFGVSLLLLSSAAPAQSNDESLAGAVVVQPKTAAPKKTAPVATEGIELGQLGDEISDLKNLIEGKLPKNVAVSALFEIDLHDEVAVSQRIAALQERLGSVTPNPEEEKAVREIRLLRAARDNLRLSFLNLPIEQRKALLEQERLHQRSKDLASEQKTSAEALATTEIARDSALSEANKATDESVRTLATEEARLLAHLSELASLRQSWVAKNQLLLEQHRKLSAHYAQPKSSKTMQPQEADALYQQIRKDLRSERGAATQALDALTAPFTLIPLAPMLDVVNPKYAPYSEIVTRIHQLRVKIELEEASLKLRETSERYAQADEIMRTLNTLQARRVALLPLLSAGVRQEVTGFSADGLSRILSEAEHVKLMLRWYPIQRIHEAKSFAALLKDVFAAGKFGMEILGLMLVLAALLLCLRRSRIWLNRLRFWLTARIQSQTLMLRVDSGMRTLIRIGNELILLLSVYIVFDQLMPERLGIPEFEVARHIAYAYAFYALALAFIHRVLLVAVSRYRVVEASLNEKILTSLRLVARVILFFVLYLILAKAMLGEGALYGIAKKLALMGSLLVAWRLIRAWRDEVTRAYLKFFPTGRLAELVRASQDRSHGLLIATAAFMFVAARGIWIWIRDGALSFEQTRKALAYLFRRQLERQSKNQSVTADPSQLPENLLAALTEEVAVDQLCIDYYPHLEETEATANALLEGRSGKLIAMKGERGSGKTTWLTELQKRLDGKLPCTLYTIETRTENPAEVCRLLCQICQLPETNDPEQLILSLLDQPPRVVLLDLGQNWMLRDVGGLAAYEMFIRIAQASVGKVLWVIAFARWSFEYLQRTHPQRDVYDEIIQLPHWTEEKISELIDTRLALAGVVADYDQLLLKGATTSRINLNDAAALQAVEKTADRYHRLIWDYSDGNPRVALHFFRLSLTWMGNNTVSVRLFPLPSMGELDTFEKRTHYLLACLVQHENLTVPEAARSLRFPLNECARSLQLLQRDGFVICSDTGRYRVNSHWNRAVLRFLQRKKLLAI